MDSGFIAIDVEESEPVDVFVDSDGFADGYLEDEDDLLVMEAVGLGDGESFG